jgi:hypothetical protein
MAHRHADQQHDCFADIWQFFNRRGGYKTRLGFFLFCAPQGSAPDDNNNHYRGNTAFAGRVLQTLVSGVLKDHVPGACANCDAVAMALKAAGDAFEQSIAESRADPC